MTVTSANFIRTNDTVGIATMRTFLKNEGRLPEVVKVHVGEWRHERLMAGDIWRLWRDPQIVLQK